MVSNSKIKVGPDSRTNLKMSDGQSDIFGQKVIFGIGRKSDEKSDIFGQKVIFGIGRKSDEKSDESRTKVGQKDKNDLKPFNITVRTVH